jgi:hypothetical protein
MPRVAKDGQVVFELVLAAARTWRRLKRRKSVAETLGVRFHIKVPVNHAA